MKKLYLILIIFIILLPLVSSEEILKLPKNQINNKEVILKLPPEKMPVWWYEMTDENQWLYFRQMSIEYVKLNEILNEKSQTNNELKNQLISSNEFLKKYKPFHPKFGISFNSELIMNKEGEKLTTDYLVGCDFLIFFLKGRFFISPGLDFKIVKNFGGGLKFGLGFLI